MHTIKFAFLLLFPFVFSSNHALKAPQSSHVPACAQSSKTAKKGIAKVVFKSADGGQTWQDISEGLPTAAQDDNGIDRNAFFTNDNGLYLTDGTGLYNSKANASAPFWTKEIFPNQQNSIAPGRQGIFAYNYQGGLTQKINGTRVWTPVYTNFQYKRLSSIFETAGGTLFISCDYGLFKSADKGKTWKQINTAGGAGSIVESNGVLVATSIKGIIRSDNNGESWEPVISEGGVGITVVSIKGGFAAITYSTASKTRRVRTSYDGGITWQPIDAGLPASLSIASIVQVGENFFCGHPKGIFKSSDKGRTWKLLVPAIDGKVFNLSVSGNVIYAIPRSGRC